MDLFSAAANAAGLVSAVSPLARRGAIEREFYRCFGRALRGGFAAQNRDDMGATASLVLDALTPKSTFRLLGDNGSPLASAEREREWVLLLAEMLNARGLLKQDVDIARLAADTARLLSAEIERAAQQPGSALFQVFVVSQLSSPREIQVEPTSEDRVSNLWSLPLAPEPISRREITEIESLLSDHPIVVLGGGAGLGKSTLAAIVARQRESDERHQITWWMNASSREHLRASCDGLLRALGIEPEDDVLQQVRRELSGHRSWFVVLDDIAGGDLVGAVIPNGTAVGSVIVTTRNHALRSPGRVMRIGSTDDETMRRIAQSLLPIPTPAGQMDELVRVCVGHPLVLATICRYVTATGASGGDLGKLIKTEPSTVFSEQLGPHYPFSFAEVIARILKSIDDVASMQVLLAAAIGNGQQISLALLESALPLATADIRAGVRRCNELGLVETGDSVVSCHAVVADMIIATVPDPSAAVATRLLAAIEQTASDSSGAQLRELAAIANIVSARATADVDRAVSVHATLAEVLAAHGYTVSAIEQIELAQERLTEDVHADIAGELSVAEARVLLYSGDYAKAIDAATRGVGLGEELQRDDIRAACLIVLAWSHENRGDRDSALRSAEAAANLMPEDPDAQAVHQRFRVPDEPTPEHLEVYLAQARDATISAPLRALSFGLASRVATKLGRREDAIAHARMALEIDRTLGGSHVDIARDLNDLGMALVDAEEFEEAEDVLLQSMEIYESENPEHPMGVPPRVHLGRLLMQKMIQSGEVDEDVLDQAIRVLEPALQVQQQAAPDSPDHAAVLVALADVLVFRDLTRAERLLEDALRIDRAAYADDHYEVGLDVLKLMSIHRLAGRPASGLRAFTIVRSAVPEWERTHPDIALQLLSLQAGALMGIGVLGALPRISRSLARLAEDERLSKALRGLARNAVIEISKEMSSGKG